MTSHDINRLAFRMMYYSGEGSDTPPLKEQRYLDGLGMFHSLLGSFESTLIWLSLLSGSQLCDFSLFSSHNLDNYRGGNPLSAQSLMAKLPSMNFSSI